MENENKNASTPSSADQKKQHNKKKFHKPKSYFMTPANAEKPQENDGSAQKNQKQPPAERPQNNNQTVSEQKDNNATAQRSQNSGHPKHKKKNKKNNVDVQRDRNQAQSRPSGNDKSETLNPTEFNIPARSKSDRLERPAPKKLEKFSESADFNKYSEYEEFTYAELYGDGNATEQVADTTNHSAEQTGAENTASSVGESNEPMVNVVGIKFKDTGKTYYFDPEDIKLKVGQHAIVKTARGLEYGDVAIANTQVKESETVPPLRPVVRIATEADIKHHEENKEKEDAAFRICNEKIIAHKLDMKLIDAQYTFDNSKLLFYFTSSGRVDFRDLVKDLAAVFRTRIELRQVGIRDEAKMVGGFGPCGRALCCSLFLTDFGQVSIKMAKEQGLSLNGVKISGICGRLMCCLRYEYETYEYEIKRTPPVDTLVRTVDGVGVVTEIAPLSGTVKVRLDASPELPPKFYKREEVSILRKKQ